MDFTKCHDCGKALVNPEVCHVIAYPDGDACSPSQVVTCTACRKLRLDKHDGTCAGLHPAQYTTAKEAARAG